MATPKISVIIPVYKVEKYICACLDSILTQSFTDFELLLINDGSPDNSGAICDEYAKKDSRIRVFHKKNEGVSKTRNLGLDNANADWIAFIDSDDFIRPDYLKHLYEAIEDDIDLIIGGEERIKEGEQNPFAVSRPENNIYTPASDFLKEKICTQLLAPYFKLIRRELIEKINLRFNERISFAEDVIFILHLINASRALKTISQIDYKYIIHKNSLISKVYSFDTEYYIYTLRKDLYLNIFKDKIPTHILGSLSYLFNRPIKSLYRKPHRLPRAERLEKLKLIYENEALIIDDMPDKSVFKKFRNNLSLLDRLLYSSHNGFLLILLKIKRKLSAIKARFFKKKTTKITEI